MHPLERRVARTIRRHGLADAGDRIAVAVSGGPDSVALTWLLHAVAPGLHVELAGLVHVNHGLRGADAEMDEQFCRDLAARLDLPIDVSRVDAGALAIERRRSIEAAARDARYACFNVAAERLRASRVATGHTLDDQAETVLLRLFRGAGSRGLAGIRVRRGPFVRPLLDCGRQDLLDYLRDRDEPFRTDLSNDDHRIPRNRIRHELLPVIDRMAPGARKALARIAAHSADDESFFREAVIRLAPSVVLPDGQVSLDALAAQPPALSRRLIRWALERAAPDVAFSAAHLAGVLNLVQSPEAGQVDLPGVVVERAGNRLVIHRAVKPGPGRAGRPLRTRFEYLLPCPGAVEVPEAGVTVLASLGRASAAGGGQADIATVRAASLELPLTVRSRHDGDRLRPLGAPGRRKLQDVFVDRKVPRQDRDRVPIVTDASGRIVWVAGVTITEEGRVKGPSEGVVILTLKKGLQ